MKSHSLTTINCGICLCIKACYGTFQTEARLFMSFQELSYNGVEETELLLLKH